MPRGPREIRIGPSTNIHRDPRGPAWTVAVERKGQQYFKHFSDRVWGGRANGLIAARRWRDQLLSRIDPDTRVRRRAPRGTRSQTGIVGVTLEPYVVGGRRYQRYVAMWPDLDIGIVRRRFSVKRYGKLRARALAAEARKAGVDQHRVRLAARQREEAAERLQHAPPMPRPVKNPLDRKGINMAARRPRCAARPKPTSGAPSA